MEVMRNSEKTALAGVLGTREWCKALLAAWWWPLLWLDSEGQVRTGPCCLRPAMVQCSTFPLRAEKDKRPKATTSSRFWPLGSGGARDTPLVPERRSDCVLLPSQALHA